MVKAIWAVACTVLVMGTYVLGGGCASSKSQRNDFSGMEAGEGPGSTLRRLTELQKDTGRQPAAPPPVPQASPVAPPATVPTPKTSPETNPRMADTGTVKNPIPPAPASTIPPAPASTAVPPSEKPETPEKAVSKQASAAKIPPAVQAQSPISGQAGSSVSPQYRIGPEDVLVVSVWGDKELTMEVVVRPDGKISLPLVQDIQAEGLTASELADLIHQNLIPFIKDPNVSVIVRQINAPKFSVMGYVSRPGTYPLRGDVTVLEALSTAGGLTPFASPRKIKIVRNAGGKQEIRKVNYYDMIDKGGKGNILLMPGDTIVVP